VERELAFLSVHSTLHLLGYDHEVSEEDEKYMNKKQEEVLTRIGLPRG
jgi:probable rRNA maturation factor